MNKTSWLILSFSSGLSLLSHAAVREKTNIIVIFCDDLGYGDLSCYGHPTIQTPNLDRLAIEGQKWTSFYVSASVSTPSRAGLLTGKLGVRTGMYGDKKRVLFPNSPHGLPMEEQTIATYLKEANYTTACVGKWHLGHLENNLPLNHGFDYFYGTPYSNDMSKKEQLKLGNKNYKHKLPFYDQDKIIEYDPEQSNFTQRFTDYATNFIKENRKEPFFLYLAHPMPHIPIYASSSFENSSRRGLYGDAVEEIDWSVGQIVSALKKYKLDKNTIVIFTSDNGPWLSYRQNGGSAGLLKDGKASTYEGGFRVPAIFWGADIEPAVISEMGSTLDLLPTFCEYANVTSHQTDILDGYSLKEVLNGQDVSPREVFYFYRGGEIYAIRKGAYKMHLFTQAAYGGKAKKKLDRPLLYNLNVDPGEHWDISSRYPDIIKELTDLRDKHVSSFDKSKPLFD